jgi:malate/lactate dehydrogenase
MKILIAGVGRFGSQIALLSAIYLKPEKIILYDIKPLSGDILDLQHACKGLELSTQITDKLEPADYIIIAAGRARTEDKPDTTLYANNIETVGWIILELQAKKIFKKTTKLIITTNPVIEITKTVAKHYPNYNVYNPESQLLELREGRELGGAILRTKGYTNFGAGVACVLLIKDIEKGIK